MKVSASIVNLPFQRKDVLSQLERARKVFTSEATEVARHMGWVKSVIFSKVSLFGFLSESCFI